MPNIYSSKRAVATRNRTTDHRGIRPAAVNEAREYGPLVLISRPFWLIFYLYIPDNLDGFAAAGGVPTPNIFARNVKVVMLAMSAYFIVTRWSVTRSLATYINFGAVAFLLLAVLSAYWSIARDDTIFRCISLASVVLVCFAACVAGWRHRRFQQIVTPPLMFILVGSLVVGVLLPDRIAEIGNDISQRGAWHGITHGKNEFGMLASFGVVVCVNRWLAREGSKYWALAGAAIAATCLVLSRSNTSQLATIVGVVSMVLVMRVPIIRRQYTTHVVIAIVATILVYELAIQNVIPGVNTLLAPITNLTGKDNTLSARTIIWNVIKQHIQGAPYLGTGYGAYWVGPKETSPSYVFTWLMFFYPTEAHNGYLEVVNDLGLVGLSCLLLFLFWFVWQALQLMRTDRGQAALYLAVLFLEMIINMSESDWFSRTNTFAIVALATCCLSRGLLDARQGPQSRSADAPEASDRLIDGTVRQRMIRRR